MSTLTIEDVKRAISVTHSDDDLLLMRLMDSAARECAKYIYGTVPDYSAAGAVTDPLMVPELATGIILSIRADYEGDPLDRAKFIEIAHSLWLPSRTDWAM